MPGDWLDTLGPKERASWESFVMHARAEAAQKIDSSAFVLQLVPNAKDVDIKFAVELGLAIMLNKPIVAIAMPGIPVPAGLRRVAHHIIEMEEDLDTDAGRQEMSDKLKPIAEGIIGREDPEDFCHECGSSPVHELDCSHWKPIADG